MASAPIFNPSEIISACRAAKAGGGNHPLAKVFSIENSARPGPNSTKYMGLSCTTPGKQGRLMVRFITEKHVGQIAPLDEAEVLRVNAERGSKYGMVKKRDRHPTINFQKYPVKVVADDQGRPTGPLPDVFSEYYAAIALVDEFFYEEVRARLADGRIVLREPRREDYRADAVIVANTKIIPMIQTHVSMEAKANPGSKLANPICRINMKFNEETSRPKKAQFYDFDKAFTVEDGRQRFEPLTFDGHPVNAQNIHMIESHSIMSGVASLNAVCASTMGLSIPMEIEILIVQTPTNIGVTVDDVFGAGMPCQPGKPGKSSKSGEGESDGAAGPGAGAEAPAPPSPPGVVPECNLAGVLNDLKVDDE